VSKQTKIKLLKVILAENFKPKISQIGPLQELPMTLPNPKNIAKIPYFNFFYYSPAGINLGN